eukprot:CAMPEP_0194478026 /NCGR_PEP_ID=MMETSP0253-20130528/1638_1 /TAXON_ID=2966 /ORGANISM="Noctiluca scintillans" /LENGTH=296 /DNA_ID=CAMNT_0039317081 /DNA_START=81 /DNA_END=971 /DNA_ORIENTATION=+
MVSHALAVLSLFTGVVAESVSHSVGSVFPGHKTICKVLNNTEINTVAKYRLCPSIVAGAENVTMEDCEDALRLFNVETEALYNCPGHQGTWPAAHKAARDVACVFVRRQDSRKADIVQELCGKFEGRLHFACTSSLTSAWAVYEGSCPDARLGAAIPGSRLMCDLLKNQAIEDSANRNICPSVVAEGYNITAEDCQDSLHLIKLEGQALFSCPGNHTPWPAAHKAAKDMACAFTQHEEPRKVDMLLKMCSKFKNRLLYACTGLLGTAWTAYEDTCPSEELAVADVPEVAGQSFVVV